MVNELNTTFKKVILLSALTVLVGIGVVYALSLNFGSSPTHLKPPITAEGVDEQVGLKLTMTLQKTEYNLGEQINITLTITNINNQTINYSYSQPNFDFRVYNDTNNDVYRWSSFQFFPDYVIKIPLKTEEGLTGVLTWPQTCNKTIDSEGVPVSPGTYYIVGQSPIYRLQTTPIQVTIVKP
jgi:hypothetical protein